MTGEVIKDFVAVDKEQIDRTVQIAKKAQSMWAQMELEDRLDCFKRLKSVMSDHVDDILSLMMEEGGKLKPDGEAEVYDVIDAIDYYSEKIKSIQTLDLGLNTQAFPDTIAGAHYVPYGVIGLIMPWNFPFYTPAMFVITATMAGNSVVMKPSEYTTMIGMKIKELFVEAGFPDGLVEIIPGAEDSGKLLVKASVDKIFFVGSVEAGQDILKNAGVKPVQLELGGNSAALILGDADLDLAANAVAWGGTYHSGQDCVAIKRVFVVESVAKEFIEKIVNIVSNLRPGIDYGPYIRSEALTEVESRIKDAVQHGAKLLYGGQRISSNKGKGNWFSPSVLILDNQDFDIVRKETFGNVLPIMVVPDEDKAVDMANDTSYGLSNAIFTSDIEKAKRISKRMQSGLVFINDPFIAIPGWDYWTGWKNSGFGTPESKIMQCLRQQTVSVNQNGQKRVFWYPYAER